MVNPLKIQAELSHKLLLSPTVTQKNLMLCVELWNFSFSITVIVNCRTLHMIYFMLDPYYVQMSWYPARAKVWKFSFSFYLISDENILEEVK
jgi:hypothetical protein